ncbi:hypothetical protein M406DRAFT_73001 [Cryphonectria parasitica EP155]|uniref:Rhodopsin domain-containing protein n=1 Tax=Cryphonectria parasitica (strain ATCC 38755 / EP155) TaxID=660469 RepID=A0A9P4XSH2_CRYP1|nr:uncharacterized protein M406DRAFT_73001 [Cryphonectria parasitica EP155]KAF3760509.1 hypothetical protein M406DRAFT_73001 [Cryphonectria parasitica EP155]
MKLLARDLDDLGYNNHQWIYAWLVVLALVGTLAVAFRVWARRLEDVKLGWDDWTAITSLAFCWGLVGISIHAVRLYLGPYTEIVSFANISMYTFIASLIYTVDVTLVKVSVLLTYYRLFPNRPMRIATRMLTALAVAWGLAKFFLTLFACHPIASLWEFAEARQCLNLVSLAVGTGVSDIVLNSLILVLPAREAWKLHLPVRYKLAVCGIFVIGILLIQTRPIHLLTPTRTVIASIFRLLNSLSSSSTSVNDSTVNFASVWIWTIAEVSLGVFGGCLLVMLPIARRIKTLFPSRKPVSEETEAIKSSSNVQTVGSSVVNTSQDHGHQRVLVEAGPGERVPELYGSSNPEFGWTGRRELEGDLPVLGRPGGRSELASVEYHR